MKKIIVFLIAVSYTLPEKMKNQLAIGSGLKGTFSITSEGEQFRTPFLTAVSDAEFSLRGISSEKDFHYYIFQTDELDNQSALSELYRKDGVCYFRSDMVQGKILSLPTLAQFLDTLFPASGDNGTVSSVISRILTLPEDVKKEKWDPVLTRYQNQLELWLADYALDAPVVQLDSGFSALDFTYEIPIKNVKEKTVGLFADILSDKDVSDLLDTVMSDYEKNIFANGNLIYYYTEALNSLSLDKPVRMNKRVSAMGDLLRFSLELPLDERTTGIQHLNIEMIDDLTIYTVKKADQILLAGIPSGELFKASSYEQSIWYANIWTSVNDEEKAKNNKSVRIDIKKTSETQDEDDKSYENDHYSIRIIQDKSYLPEEADSYLLTDYEPASIEIDLQYSSKYAQNSATNLNISADFVQGSSSIKADCKLKTAAPWLFMPFEVIDPIEAGSNKDVLISYVTDWISNASSVIRHVSADTETVPESSPESVPDEDNSSLSEENTPHEIEIESSEEAEAQPLDEPELP